MALRTKNCLYGNLQMPKMAEQTPPHSFPTAFLAGRGKKKKREAQMDNSLWPGWNTVRKIGTGSFGTVYEIERNVFGEPEKAAIKVISIPRNQDEVEELRNEGFDDSNINFRFESSLKDIVHEYSLMAKMKGNSNTVYCDDIKYVRSEDGLGWKIYIKMELLTPLVKTIQSVRSDRQILQLARDICSALVMCKRFNIVHRDIKPQNIFVAKDGTFKLGDFGIAKTSDRTTSGTVVGTYKYMAPEVFNCQPYGSSADIYSLGLVLYWLLNERRTPFLPLPPQVPTAAMEEEARRRRFLGEAIPAPKNGSPALKKIVLKACAFDVNDRYGSAAEMLNAVDRLLKTYKTVSGRPMSAPAKWPDSDTPTDNGTEIQTKREKSEFRKEELSTTELDPQLMAATQAPVSEFEKGKTTVALIQPAREAAAESTEPEDAGQQKAKKGFLFLKKETNAKNAGPKRLKASARSAAPKKRNKTRKDAPGETDQNVLEGKSKKKTAAVVAAAVGLTAALGGAITLASGGNAQADWSDWTDRLPKQVTEENYTIEERTLYRTRQLETAQTTESNQMDGWELYDTAESNGEFGPWSWTTAETKPTDTREVKTQLRYRYSDKETATGDSDSMPGWTLEGTTTEWENYGPWSSWSQNAVTASDSREVQTQTRYRYRTKETTTSTSASLFGWIQDGATTIEGEWGAWSGWSETPVSGSSTTQVETKTQYSYRDKSFTTSDSNSLNGWTQYDYDIEYGSWSIWSETPVFADSSIDVETKEETVEYGGETYSQRYYRYREIRRIYYYYIWNAWSEYSDSPVSADSDREVRTRTMYRSRTHGPSTATYKYYRWSGWSDWSTTPVSKNDSREVQTQTDYRYRDRTGKTVYHFFRWKKWSAWSDTEVIPTEDRRVETKTFYRFRDRVDETTYYFHRWTEWTDYTEEPAEASESLEVEMKTEYRYRSKEREEATT